MNDPLNLPRQFVSMCGEQTLATIRDEAAREMNGTCVKSFRLDGGPRIALFACMTGEYEIKRAVKGLQPQTKYDFGDWRETRILDAFIISAMRGGFCYAFERKSGDLVASIMFIAAAPDSITSLERIFLS